MLSGPRSSSRNAIDPVKVQERHVTKSTQFIAAIIAPISSQWALIALADPGRTKQEPLCESRVPEFGDMRNVTCVFTASGSNQHVSFKVRFLGSHDDTQLSMTSSLNKQPLTCGPGSKTSSRFEDGEITLECRFSVKAKADSRQTLEMGIVWTHAQYDDFEITVK
jgi:hypothetical protein